MLSLFLRKARGSKFKKAVQVVCGCVCGGGSGKVGRVGHSSERIQDAQCFQARKVDKFCAQQFCLAFGG